MTILIIGSYGIDSEHHAVARSLLSNLFVPWSVVPCSDVTSWWVPNRRVQRASRIDDCEKQSENHAFLSVEMYHRGVATDSHAARHGG